MFPASQDAVPPGRARQRSLGDAGPDEPKRSFLRVVSHELRTPLNSILGFSEILASELYGPLGADQYREYAEIIRSSGEKLLKLVNEVIELARLQAGDVEFDVQPERLAPVFDTLGEGLAETLAARRLRLAVQPCGEAEALVDACALRIVLANLLQNAIAFSPDGAEVRVCAHENGAWLEIVIENDGEGVDPADLERLVRPFEQGENVLTRQGEGAGLGLAICDLTCQAMGARLRLVSERGHGFAAHVLLPGL
ncbi:MAG: sensor histidine kinase [Phenylobacterium sp.]|nr:sensor histidine kinase [Phenylobacterium sp.]